MRPSRMLLAAAGLLAATAPLLRAQIERLDLPAMVDRADDAIVGRIDSQRVLRVERPDGERDYFTILAVRGRSLYDGREHLVEVVYRGGFVDEEEGVHNSEAPAADDVVVGNRVVAFHQRVEDLGTGYPVNALYAAHGGLYRVLDGPGGEVVLGRGEGYAIARNARLENLRRAVAKLLEGR